MKQRSSPHYQPKYTSNDEIEVAEVLLKLHTLIAESEYGLQLPLSWGSKRRRSADDSHRRVLLPSTPFPSLHGIGGLLVSVFDPDKTKTAVKVEASSPATPLSFSPSESDEKPKRLKRKASAKKVCSCSCLLSPQIPCSWFTYVAHFGNLLMWGLIFMRF